MLAFREAPDDHALIPRGIAADSKLLFVADTAFDAIVVIDVATMALIRRFPAPRPGKLAIDGSGDLWAICDSGKRVAAYSAEGKPRIEKLPLPPGAVADGLGFDREGRLLVCDNGPSQQIHVFAINREPPSSWSPSARRGECSPAPSPARADRGDSLARPARVATRPGIST